jgi:hypothetical protein
MGQLANDDETPSIPDRLIASLPLAVLVIIGVLAMLPARPGVTKGNFDRIENGMTLAEVDKIFGKPGSFGNDLPTRTSALSSWRSENDELACIFFDHGIVYDKEWHGETIIDRIRRWLHLA